MYFQNMLSNQQQNAALIKAASSKGGSKLKNKSQTGGQQLNDYISEVHEFIRNGNHEEINNQGGGSKKNIEDMLVFGGAKNKKGRYYGPFASPDAVNKTINTIQRIFLLRSCSDKEVSAGTKLCFNYYLKRDYLTHINLTSDKLLNNIYYRRNHDRSTC